MESERPPHSTNGDGTVCLPFQVTASSRPDQRRQRPWAAPSVCAAGRSLSRHRPLLAPSSSGIISRAPIGSSPVPCCPKLQLSLLHILHERGFRTNVRDTPRATRQLRPRSRAASRPPTPTRRPARLLPCPPGSRLSCRPQRALHTPPGAAHHGDGFALLAD